MHRDPKGLLHINIPNYGRQPPVKPVQKIRKRQLHQRNRKVYAGTAPPSHSCTHLSDSASSALVASSSSTTSPLLRRARAMAILCFCPPDSWAPLSPTNVWYPSVRADMNPWAFADVAASTTSDSDVPGRRVVEPLRERDHGALPAPAGAHEGEGLAGAGAEAQVLEDQDVGTGRVREVDVLELDLAAELVGGGDGVGVVGVDFRFPVN
ncbi:unnamed protein product [Cuscuta campestris]|uniref:Uncharacterized protein n=1 Tax=Cuscuta campestris TaxID=132261 RepID=A0A484NS79_9ASTE|nr:unnamed protein product [Cuscuta campestris]